MNRRNLGIISLTIPAACLLVAAISFAQSAPTKVSIDDAEIAGEINKLNDEIKAKRSNVDSLQDRIETFRAQIEKQQRTSTTLQDQVSLLENRIAKTELTLKATQAEREVIDDEITVLSAQISAIETQLARNRELIADLLRSMEVNDHSLVLEALFSTNSFAELFDQLQYLANINEDLSVAVDKAKIEQAGVEMSRKDLEGRHARLANLEKTLQETTNQLAEERGAKDTLFAESKQSESQYQSLLSQLREEEAYINHQIGLLQGAIEAKLADADGIKGPTVLSWPVDPSYRGISTRFHDPTYPFRHLFEHSGLDIPQKQGTPVVSAAPGYVAWTRVGSQYGNYVMVIHTNGIATLYAHLSKITVKPDQFLARGATIGLSGGMPGTAGAGLSTGPHLHFEARKNGIPVDPMPLLVGSN